MDVTSSIKVEPLYGGFMMRISYLIGDRVVGILEGNRNIWNVEVKVEDRNKGIGTALLRSFAEKIVKPLSGQTHHANIAMRRTFEKAGFVQYEMENEKGGPEVDTESVFYVLE